MKMKTMWALVLIFVSLLPAFAGGGEWVFTDPPLTQSTDGSYVRNPSASIRGDWKQNRVLHGSPTALPDRLPGMGSRENMLDYIVASNNFAMNVNIGLVIEEPASEYFSLRTGRWSDGYRSYSEALTDIGTGFALVWNKFRTNNLPQDSLVYATITVTYFHDNVVGEDRGNGLALQVYNPVDRLNRVTLEKILASIEIDDPIDYGQVIVRVPRLTSINMKVEVQPGLIAELDWTAAGAKPSTLWRTLSSREWTTATYLYLRNWYADGSKPGRFTLRSQAGQVVTYTQYGDNLGDVRLEMLRGATAIRVSRPRGATVDLSSSPDLVNWTYQIGVQVGSEPTMVNIAQPLSIVHFFKGEAF